MAGRIVQLSGAKDGISRQRIKGGADKDSLYDLVNGHVDETGAIVSRPGTVEGYALPAGTKGLCSANGGLVVFSHQVVAGMPDGVSCEVLPHPTDSTLPIIEIHFAAPFLGGDDGAYLYVAAEFSNGDVYHYWLQSAQAWEAGKGYCIGDVVRPTDANGLTYRATRTGSASPTWKPNVARAIGDVVEPTTANCFKYTVVNVIGPSPKSGETEPAWPTEDGATVYEDTGVGTPPGDTTTRPVTDVPPEVGDRYGRGRAGDDRMIQ